MTRSNMKQAANETFPLIVHMHGFKCAGTTFSASLAANFGQDFRCVEPSTRFGKLDWDLVQSKAVDMGLLAVSSHALKAPQVISANQVFVHLVREPSSRLLSAWRFEVGVQKSFEGPFSTYLTDKGRIKNHQSRFLLPQAKVDNFQPNHEYGADWDLFKHRSNLFLGVVERYDETMTILELILRQKSINVDLSYPDALNQQTAERLVADTEIPDDFVNLDRILYLIANQRLDFYASLFANFNSSLELFRERCSLFGEHKKGEFRSRVANKNWLYVR